MHRNRRFASWAARATLILAAVVPLIGCSNRPEGPRYDRSYAADRQPSSPEAGPRFGAEPSRQFRDYGTTPYTYSQDERRNTFAVDVDTASYALAARFLRQGQLPPAEAVRTEEFLNALDYNYPSPARGELAIQLAAFPAPFREPAHLLRVALQARRVHPADRQGSNLVLLLDASGSMAEAGKLDLVKRSCRLLLDGLDERDKVAVIRYDTQAQRVLGWTRASERGPIGYAIDRLQPGGRTSVQAGLDAAYSLAAESFDKGRTNRVVLFSDGVANTDATEAEPILAAVADRARKGITLTAIGVGFGEYNDVLLEQLADKGNGNYHYIDTPEQAQRVLGAGLTANTELAAKDVKVQVEFDTSVVRRYRLMGYENRALANRDFRNDRVDSGEMGSGGSVTALYALELKEPPGGKARRIATVRVRYQKPGGLFPTEMSESITTGDLSRRFDQASDASRLAAAAAYFAELLRETYWSRGYSLRDVAGIVRGVHVDAGRRGQVDELLDMIAQADRLRPAGRARPADTDDAEALRLWWEE